MSYDLRGKSVYLCGPMSGIVDLNVPAFADAEERCIRAGASTVFNPAAAWGHADRPKSWYMLHDLHHLTRMAHGRPCFDCLVMLPGWHVSGGATLECQVACACGIALVSLLEVGE